MTRVIVLLAIVCALPLAAHATDDKTAAKKLFESGTKHFDLNEFDAALSDFKEGYRLMDDPVFLYNIAQCYRLTNHNVEAARFYKSYLRRKPDAANRKEVEVKIKALEDAMASEEKARSTPKHDVLGPGESGAAPAEPAPAPAPIANPQPPVNDTAGAVVARAPERPTPVYKKWWLWTIVGGVVVAGVAVGLGVGLSSSGGVTHGPFPTVSF